MLRKKVASKVPRRKGNIQWRGHEVTRIEAFSDAVFAFSITLLIVSLEVPHTYDELMEGMSFFIPFAICFLIVMTIWYAQNIFFRRYGLHDFTTMVLNCIMLFMVLFYVYPLKFIFGSMFTGQFHVDNTHQASNLFFIYSGGFAAIYLLFAGMYKNAARQKEALDLSPLEVFETNSHMYSHLIIAAVGCLSVFLAYKELIQWAGFAYFLIGPAVSGLYTYRHHRQKTLFPHTAPMVAQPIDDVLSV